MANFYYGSDSGQNYWINLNHVYFVNPEENRLILKMLGDYVIAVEGDDIIALKQVLWSQTLNWEDEFRDDKRTMKMFPPGRR
ncbi:MULTISPECIES: hypothetical protein [unclassified Microcystis]|jgi:hypothetical protein|uniref:Uncharacterized protein n=1 Tax=Microcystis aeruginosa Ma_QC_Ca_00000000_S207 TaxID=2486251 RepID=A0A552FPX7_MICAE|nr:MULTISPECIES: hypothetical protein [unclassified Microcystis]MCA2927674.1 hypothetical protein [Microcystis sp. M020S1]MCA2935166.1 hypothetical protein [Microcystis sp. M015S1]NCR57715.1 hypothetical protein [Microcystis aeruginosa LL13-06]TRU48788.1 MAG: hypothetical protein EWV91_08660 [Microcystis aeruginosa Ma_QC_Ca_00000000_S207]MCA2618282.1 hypothetical protein [Microcystis sp. M099S2]